jgi:uncharacterized DUF497 family protein
MTSHPRHAQSWEWDEANESELAAHHIDPEEVHQVWAARPQWAPNRKHRAGDWKMLGRTLGGRRLAIVVRYLPESRALRPITGWDATAVETSKYFK